MTSDSNRPLTIRDLLDAKREGRKIVVLTCYDALTARVLDPIVDLLLVGDSVNQVVAGHGTTLSATLDQMIYHASAVRRGANRALVFVDLPFLTYQISIAEALRNAGRVLQEIRALVQVGIPVMGHLGLTPQSVNALGGYRVQGREADTGTRLLEDAKALEEAGACSMVLELIPAELAGRISAAVRVPTIGIGAGPSCDGQVLVLQDMLGLNQDFTPKFLKKYADLTTAIRQAATAYADDVRAGKYPGKEHSFE